LTKDEDWSTGYIGVPPSWLIHLSILSPTAALLGIPAWGIVGDLT